MMRRVLPFLLFLFITAVVAGGCMPAGPVDEEVKEALTNLVQTDVFTPEERDAVVSISVHNEEAKVRLRSGFSDDQPTITATGEKIAKELAEEFYKVAMKYDFKQPKYNVEVWMKIKDDKGSFDALVCEWYYDLQRSRTDGRNFGLGRSKDIR